MGLIIKTDDYPVMVFRDDKGKYPRYSLGVSSKGATGEWIRGYVPCKFKKGVEVENMTKIKINNCFPIASQGEKYVFVSWMITDFEVIETIDGRVIDGQDQSDFMAIPEGIEEELPFK